MTESPTLVALVNEVTAIIRERNELREEVESLRLENVAYAPYVRQGADNRPKLTRREADGIRKMVRQGYTQREMADVYAVNPATISRIVRGQYHRKGAA